jgi:acylpyruvate hydrolase
MCIELRRNAMGREEGRVRVATARVGEGTVAVRVEGDELVSLPQPDVGALLASGPGWAAAAASGDGERLSAAETVLAPVVPRPEKIFCVGLNYRAHAEEAGLPIPEAPVLFGKYWRTLIGPTDPLVLPANSDRVDWEAELAVVIGTPCRSASPEQARAAIAGYTVFNDVSMRDWQKRTSQFHQGKNFEASNPMGPHLVTLDELDDPDALRITATLDGETMQDSSTADLIFPVVDLVAYISEFITLMPGDVIATGTPSGVGGARKPPIFLAPGQTLRVAVEGVGEIVTPILAPGSTA